MLLGLKVFLIEGFGLKGLTIAMENSPDFAVQQDIIEKLEENSFFLRVRQEKMKDKTFCSRTAE